MMPTDFPMANTKLAFEYGGESVSVPAYATQAADGQLIRMTMWRPSREDLEAINNGAPICMIVRGEGYNQTVGICTFDQETGKPNI